MADPYSSTAPLFAGQTVPESVRARLLAAQLLGQSATSSNQPFTAKGLLFAKAAAGLLSGFQEKSLIDNEQAAQAAHRAALLKALPLPGLGGAPNAMAPVAPADPSQLSPSAATPAATPAASPPSPAAAMSYAGPDASQGSPSLSASDRDLAIRTIAGEAGGESPQGQAAVAAVIRNRVASGNYGGSMRDVIMAPKQFSVWNQGDPAGNIARGLDPNSAQYQKIGQIVDGVASGQIPDPTNGADHYYNPKVASPAWGDALGARNSVTIGNHRFVGGSGAATAQADIPAANAQPVLSSTLPPGITPDMVAASPADDASSTGSGLAGSARSQAMASALLQQPSAALTSGWTSPATAPGADGGTGGNLNALDYALKPSGTRDQFAPSPAVGGMGSVPTTIEPSMFAPPDPSAPDLPDVGQATQGAGAAAIGQALSDPAMRSALAGALAAPSSPGSDPGSSPGSSPSTPSDDDGGPAAAPPVASAPPPPVPAAMPLAPTPQPPAAQQALASALATSPTPMNAPAASPSPPPQAMAAALLAPQNRGAFDPSSPQSFNAQQASGGPPPAMLASLLGGGSPPVAGNAGGFSAPPSAMAAALRGGAPALPSSPTAPPPALQAPSADPGAFGGLGGGLGSLLGLGTPAPQPATQASGPLGLLADPRTSPQEEQMLLSRLYPQRQYLKTDNGDIVGVDPSGRLPPQVVFQGGKYTAAHNGRIFNESTGLPPGGGSGDSNGFRPASAQERQAYGVADGRPMYMGPGGEPHFGEPETAAQGETAEAKKAGETAGDRRNTLLAAADEAPDKIARLKLLGTVLDATKTGPLSQELGNATAIAQRLGIPNERLADLGIDPNGPVNNAVANKLAGELVVGSIGAKGGGFPASNFSIAERQFLEGIYPNIENQPGANDVVRDVQIAGYQRTLQKADDWAAYKQQARGAGKSPSFEDFEDQFRQAHAGDNIFAPIVQKYQQGGYTPYVPGQAGASVPGGPQPASPSGAAADPMAQARAAMAAGVPRAAVIQRLQQNGINPAGL